LPWITYGEFCKALLKSNAVPALFADTAYFVAERTQLLAVVANCLDRASFLRFLALLKLFVCLRLFAYVRVSRLIISTEIVWGNLPTRVAVDAGVVHIPLSRGIIRKPIRLICHDSCPPYRSSVN
jgi:hypothetical protein